MTEILKPCPFCGGKAEYYQSSSKRSGHGESSDMVGIRCGCKVSILYEDYADHLVQVRKGKAALLWNRRV